MSKFSPSYGGIGNLLVSEMMQAEMLRRAVLVKVRAEATAPVAKTGDHRGRYKAAFRASAGVRDFKTRRACGRVTNSAPEAKVVEFGSRRNRKYRTLGNALDAAHG